MPTSEKRNLAVDGPGIGEGANAGDSSLVPVDGKILAQIKFDINNGHKVKFQFPPKITQEGNKSEWDKHDLWGIEPLNIHKGSAGRSMTMEWEYVCTDATWNGELISTICRELKTYFFVFKREIYPVAQILYAPIIPVQINFRIMSADITYSPELVLQGDNAYPLHTKVTVGLELATKINKENGTEEKLKVQPLDFAVYEWY